MAVATVLSLLGALASARPAQDSIVYELSPASRFQVKTGKAGLFGFAGHTHVIRARAVSGRIVYYPHAPAKSRVEIVVPADSLEVLTPPDTQEIRKVTQAMRAQVLHVEQYREIRFVSKAVTPDSNGFLVRGELTLAGQTRDVTVDVHVGFAGDTLRAAGTFAIKQTDFGIRPYRGGPGGTVRVANQVTFDFEGVGVARAGP
jgi:polyisoprenoid-binding protein YceI